jgi:hypothetical protein
MMSQDDLADHFVGCGGHFVSCVGDAKLFEIEQHLQFFLSLGGMHIVEAKLCQIVLSV